VDAAAGRDHYNVLGVAGAVAEVELSFYEAARGTRKTIRYRREAECVNCEAAGSTQCPACGGSRTVEQERELDLLFPSGITDGDQFQLPGDDEAFVHVHVAPQPADSALVRAVAAVGLLVAISFLALVLFR
jgi:DnaJ-class molecular chaperone